MKKILGRKSILTTQRYVELYEELYDGKPRGIICDITLNIQEAKKLKEQGFKYEKGEYDDDGNSSTTTIKTPKNSSKPFGNR